MIRLANRRPGQKIEEYVDYLVREMNADREAALKVFDGGTGASTASGGRTNLGLGHVYTGTGSPEGVLAAPVGSIYSRTDGGASTSIYIKESGASTTGWIAK